MKKNDRIKIMLFENLFCILFFISPVALLLHFFCFFLWIFAVEIFVCSLPTVAY